MNRLSPLFLIGLLGVFLLFENARENLWADDSTMQKVRSITDEWSESMKKIQRGELTLDFHTTNEEHPSFSVQKTLNIVFDDKKMMVIHNTDRTVIYAFNCYQTETFAYFTTSPANIVGSPPPANLDIQDFHLDKMKIFPSTHLRTLKETVDTREFTVPDHSTLWRVGQTVVPIEGLERKKLENVFVVFKKGDSRWRKNEEESLRDDNGGFYHLQLVEESIEGSDCYKVSWNFVSSLIQERVVTDENGKELHGKEKIEYLRPDRLKGQQTYWIDKSHGSLIRKAVVHLEDAALPGDLKQAGISPFVSTLTNKLLQDTKSGIWYPSSWTYTQTRGGKLYEHEKGTLEYKSINQPIPAERFSLENIAELKPNCPVEWHLDSPPPGKGNLIWDGKKIVGLGFDNDSYEAAKRKHRIAFIVLVNVLIISTLIFVQFLRVWNRRRNDKT